MSELVTVLMPVRNEANYIERSFGSVLEQTYRPLEILIVDGNSTDGTRALVEQIAARHAAQIAPDQSPSNSVVRIIDNPEQTAPFALNRGISEAQGEIIVRVDGHCEIGPDYVERGVQHLANGTGDGIGGVLDTIGETAVARTIAGAMSSRLGVGSSGFRTLRGQFDPLPVDTVAFPAYRRQTLIEAGSFDEDLVRNQDDEFNYRLRKLGKRIVLVDDMPSRYYSRATFARLLRQYFQYGLYKVRVLQKHPRQMRWRQFVPAAMVCGFTLAGLALALRLPGGSATAAALSLAYGGLLALAGIANVGRLGLGAAAGLPLAIALMHLGYGTGFLCGLVRFAGRWSDRKGAVRDFDDPATRKAKAGR